jgi:CRP/FNR family cyclic AMP-dependent transcriptional regulator
MVNLPLGKGTDAPISFKAGTVLFHEGEQSKFLYLVKKGEVRLLKASGQKLNVINICKEKNILNEVSVLTNKPVEYAAIAKTDVELVLVEQKDINTVIKNGPEWVSEMFETLCERLSHTLEMIQEHNLMAGEKNASFVLTKDEEKKYLELLSKK